MSLPSLRYASLNCRMVFSDGIYACEKTGLVWFGLVSLFNDISTLFRLFNAKAILLEEQ